MRHHAGKDFDGVRLLALGRKTRLAGTAAIEIVLDVLDCERQQRRAAIDHAADRDPVALAEGRDPEHVAEGVEGHFSKPEIGIEYFRKAPGSGVQIYLISSLPGFTSALTPPPSSSSTN